jgi:hypothetical protein
MVCPNWLDQTGVAELLQITEDLLLLLIVGLSFRFVFRGERKRLCG